MFELLVSKMGKELITLPLDKETFRIGRIGTNDLSLPDPAISRHQCQLISKKDRVILEDHSGRGTLVDGETQKKTALQPGSKINLGNLEVTLREQTKQPAPAKTQAGGGTSIIDGAATPSDDLILSGQPNNSNIKYKLQGSTISLGSDPANDLVIKENFVSKFHCRIFRKGDGWFVTDLDSTNGTYLNGIRIVEARLEPKAILALGQLKLSVNSKAPTAPETTFQNIVSVDPAMKPIFDIIQRAAPTCETVLISGESGSGKELAAQAIHKLSKRSKSPVVSLNCSAMSRELLESELFGHEKGAFTGAQAQRKGLFEEANSGTLFLDEIGELHLDMQAKLLRALENGEIRRVGSNQPFNVDVRVIAATNRSLAERVQSGDFREDLYYRICVIEIILPPLRRRPKDIPILAQYFLDQVTSETEPKTLSPKAIEALSKYKYPGNVRELKHIITRAAILCPQTKIEPEHLQFSPPTLADRVAESKIYRKGKTLREVEIETMRQALDANDGNQKAAARVLGIARSTMIHKMEKYGISSKEFETG
jgi:DNA-binding NtrC family response regulator